MRFFEERQLPTIGDHALTSLPDDQSVITGKKCGITQKILGSTFRVHWTIKTRDICVTSPTSDADPAIGVAPITSRGRRDDIPQEVA